MTGIHGENWRIQLPALIERHPVYTVDTLGEPGASVQTEPLTTGEERAQCLDEVLAALELERVHLAGLSAGGWQSFNQARHRPERLASVTLFDPANTLANELWPEATHALTHEFPERTSARLLEFVEQVDGGT